MYKCNTSRVVGISFLLAVWLALPAQADRYTQAKDLCAQGKWSQAIPLLVDETDTYPAHDPARMLLAEAYEKTGRIDEAIQSWKDVLAVSRSPKNLSQARQAVSRLRRAVLDERQRADIYSKPPEDEFYVTVRDPDWSKMRTPDGKPIIHDKKYIEDPKIHNAAFPPMLHKTAHFDVYSYNEDLSKLVGERCEMFLDFVGKIFLDGESWAVRFPIIIYSDRSDYTSHGGIAGGVTFSSRVDGRTSKMLMYSTTTYLDENDSEKEVFSKFKFDSILQHEMLHVLMNEFMGAQQLTRWWNEGLANRFMRTMPQYGVAADLARAVASGEHFRLRDLFVQTQYAQDGLKNSLLYTQGHAIMLYLSESGQETIRAFLTELRDGESQDTAVDAAVAAALGIPEEGAVEELERRWVDWMRFVLLNHLDDPNLKESKHAKKSTAAIFAPWVNELDTVKNLTDWESISLDSLDSFLDVGGSKKNWSTRPGALRCDVSEEESPSILGVRMNPAAPAVLTCEVRFLGDPDGELAWFGIGQLGFQGDDTSVSVATPLRDNNKHEVVCIWTDDLAIYVDGKCTGRYPSYLITGDAPDVDYPLALIAYGPLEIQNVKVAAINEKDWSDEPVEVESDDQEDSTKPGREPKRRRRPSGPVG